jgi:subtilisin family serine protease
MTAPHAAPPRPMFDIRPVLFGLILGVTTLLYGFGLGVVFGLNEEALKAKLTGDANAVLSTVYEGDATKIRSVVNGSFTYMQRAHLHAGGLGAVAVTLSVVLVLLGTGTGAGAARVVSSGLGIGALGYSTYWMWAGLRAPSLGGTGAAKESLAWFAIPASGIMVASTAAVLGLLVMALVKRK